MMGAPSKSNLEHSQIVFLRSSLYEPQGVEGRVFKVPLTIHVSGISGRAVSALRRYVSGLDLAREETAS